MISGRKIDILDGIHLENPEYLKKVAVNLDDPVLNAMMPNMDEAERKNRRKSIAIAVLDAAAQEHAQILKDYVESITDGSEGNTYGRWAASLVEKAKLCARAVDKIDKRIAQIEGVGGKEAEGKEAE